jgi:hypothetical protein
MTQHILSKLKQEAINAIPAIIYFVIAFNLIHFSSDLAREPGDIQYFSYFTMTLSALIIGKVLVIVNCFSFINAFPRKPIIYNISWKMLIYMACINLLVVLHILLHAAYRLQSFTAAYQRLLFDLRLPIFWSTEMFLILAFLVYITFSEFVRVLGKGRVHHMLFG